MTPKKINKLVKQAQVGEKSAFEKLYRYFFSQIYYFVYSRVNNMHDAQEIVSDVFLSIIESIRKFRGNSSFKNYIFGITKNKIRDFIRRKYKYADYIPENSLPEDSFSNLPAKDPDQNSTYLNKLRQVLKVIYKFMRPRYAMILHLRFHQMHTLEEIAKKLGLSVNNVKVIQHRAIKQAANIWTQLRETKYKNIALVGNAS